MPNIKTRFYCFECDDVCEKRPFFNFYTPHLKHTVGPEGWRLPGAQLLCVGCKHSVKDHKFSFMKPRTQRKEGDEGYRSVYIQPDYPRPEEKVIHD